MTIITECPSCDEPVMVVLTGGLTGTWMPHDCDNCGETMVIEQTRTDGKTYDEDDFVTDVLPEMDDIERVDHPSGEAHIYADPDRIGMKDPDS